MGVGFVLVVASRSAERARRALARRGVAAWAIGEIRPGGRGVEYR
jgi:phosphoribosylaminoimidazole (AIR) synthetase